MRQIILFCAALLIVQAAIAQASLRGVVTYQNTGKRMQAIQVTARGASPAITKATSDQEGVFKLVFPNKKPGERVILDIVARTYDLVNHARELEVVLPNNETEKEVRLVVCRKGERDQNAVDYYEISTDYLTKSYEHKQAQLSQQVARLEAKIGQAEGDVSKLRGQLAELRKEKDELDQYYQNQLDNAWQLAEDFSRIDLAQADTIYKQAFRLFKDGKIGAAREILSSQERQENLNQLRKKEKEIAEEESKIAALEEAVANQKERLKKEKEELQKGKEKEIENYLLGARLAKLEFDFKAAAENLLAAVELDSTNVDNLRSVAFFYGELNQQKRAIQFYRQALRHTQAESQEAALLNSLGNELTYNNQYRNAESAYLKALESYQRLAVANPERYEPDVASTQNNLGLMYAKLNAYEQADASYAEALAIRIRLSQSNPERYEPGVAMTQLNLGSLYFRLNNFKKAELAYKESIKISRKLASTNPNSFEPDLASALIGLGSVNVVNNQYDQAEATYQEALKIYQRLAQSNGERYEPDVASTQNNLGLMYFVTGKTEKAMIFLDQSLPVYQKIAEKSPQAFDLEVARTLLMKALIFLNQGKQSAANEALMEAKALAEKYPDAPFSAKVLQAYKYYYK